MFQLSLTIIIPPLLHILNGPSTVDTKLHLTLMWPLDETQQYNTTKQSVIISEPLQPCRHVGWWSYSCD
jgi:hypothetical protein